MTKPYILLSDCVKRIPTRYIWFQQWGSVWRTGNGSLWTIADCGFSEGWKKAVTLQMWMLINVVSSNRLSARKFTTTNGGVSVRIRHPRVDVDDYDDGIMFDDVDDSNCFDDIWWGYDLKQRVFSFRTVEPVDCAWNHTQFMSVKFSIAYFVLK